MTDLEITKLCAEAMESPPTLPGSSSIWGGSISLTNGEKKVSTWVRSTYDPLHNDAQAFALSEKMSIQIHHHGFAGSKATLVTVQGKIKFDGPVTKVCGTDLKHAICECVAKMQNGKNEPTT